MKFRALDLFCCAGGASMGLHRAGFDVTGVDIAQHDNYPFRFIQEDALLMNLRGYDFVWLSPPCQRFTTLKHLHQTADYDARHADLIEESRRLVLDSGLPYIIENVPAAPLIEPVMLCGSMFGLNVRRHRHFESNIKLHAPVCNHAAQPEPIDVSGTGARRVGPRLDGKGGNSRKPRNLEEARAAMGIDWMSRKELAEAIPPAYSEFLARQVIAHL